MPNTDDLWTQALQEAYATAPTEEVILHTLELRHPAFVEEGVPVAARVVADFGVQTEAGDPDPDLYGHMLTLEADAPMNAGETVKFLSCMFDFKGPNQLENGIPSIELKLDNVSEIISQYMRDAIAINATLDVTYREYLLSDTSAPGYILNGFTLSDVRITSTNAVGTARFADLYNKSFPNKVYRADDYPGLAR